MILTLVAPDPQLAFPVAAPALDPGLANYHTRVVSPRGYGDDGQTCKGMGKKRGGGGRSSVLRREEGASGRGGVGALDACLRGFPTVGTKTGPTMRGHDAR